MYLLLQSWYSHLTTNPLCSIEMWWFSLIQPTGNDTDVLLKQSVLLALLKIMDINDCCARWWWNEWMNDSVVVVGSGTQCAIFSSFDPSVSYIGKLEWHTVMHTCTKAQHFPSCPRFHTHTTNQLPKYITYFPFKMHESFPVNASSSYCIILPSKGVKT